MYYRCKRYAILITRGPTLKLSNNLLIVANNLNSAIHIKLHVNNVIGYAHSSDQDCRFLSITITSTSNRSIIPLPFDCYLDEVLLSAMPKKDGWGGLADGPQAMEVVVYR